MNVLLAGYGLNTPESHLRVGRLIGERLAQRGDRLVCGGTMGLFEAAQQASEAAGGKTLWILEPHQVPQHVPMCVAVFLARSKAEKHSLLIHEANALIALGGGPGTQGLLEKAEQAERPIAIIVQGSGGSAEQVSHPRAIWELERFTTQEMDAFLESISRQA